MTLQETKLTVQRWILSCTTQQQLELSREVVNTFINTKKLPMHDECNVSVVFDDLNDTIEFMHNVVLLRPLDQIKAKALFLVGGEIKIAM